MSNLDTRSDRLLDLHLRLREMLIEEFVEYGLTTGEFRTDFLSNLLLAVDKCFRPDI